MPISRTRVREALKQFDFQALLIDELGWDRHRMQPLALLVDGNNYKLNALAEKRGMVAFLCEPDKEGEVPPYSIRRKIENQVRRAAHEHIILYVDRNRTTQVWQWVRREPGRPAACREHQFNVQQRGDGLVQKLEAISFSLDEEEALTIAAVAGRARQAFDVDRVTKRFYERFTAEHAAFLDFIKGIHSQGDREWYASLMLNRLMFTYFIQKKGFLDGDRDYLRNRLKSMRSRKGKDKFLPFYRHFLLRLFHEGLGQQKHTSELDTLIGEVPYLNGGLFDVHLLERNNPKIEIADSAFEKVFDFFDGYQWHLDERPLRADNEINPDVLGYIFEKYVNQRQMGAYYTKEDITEYIAKNSVVPFLFDEAEKKCSIAFKPDGAMWRLLRVEPDRYIYRAARDQERLPTETERQYRARQSKYVELKKRLAAGKIHTANDLVTYNIDIRQVAQDSIENSEGPELLRAFYRAIEEVTILDPTCGSGAFLFAALNILEPLYEACLDRMQVFVADSERSADKGRTEKFTDFRKLLARVNEHPNRRYFILKSIVINNLYGVDIMEEAVEICKLRLFLKLVAQVDRVEDIEPLPDIDFNIRPGNTLVGFVNYGEVKAAVLGDFQARMDLGGAMDRIDEEAEIADRAFQKFREMQTEHGMDAEEFADAKMELRHRLDGLVAELDRYLAAEYGVDPNSMSKTAWEIGFAEWRASHQPFHWFVEFYGIMKRGGFDAIIGNPPYVAVSKVGYLSRPVRAIRFPDIYAYVLMRTLQLSGARGRCGMIVPLSLTFSTDLGTLRQELCTSGESWFSSYDNIPASLFEGVSQRCTIWAGAKGGSQRTSVSPMYRWRAGYRDSLISNVSYSSTDSANCGDFGLPKLASDLATPVLSRIVSAAKGPHARVKPRDPRNKGRLGFSQSARNFVSSFLADPPCLDEKSLEIVTASKVGYVTVRDDSVAEAGLAMLVGETFMWYWLTRGDGFDVTSWIVYDFLQSLNAVPERHFELLAALGQQLHARRFEALVFKKNAGRFVGNYNYRGTFSITRRADLTLLAGLGLGRAETEEILNYVQQVLSINVFAGEKAIPEGVKSKFPPKPFDQREETKLFERVDEVLVEHYGYSDFELDFVVNHDIAVTTELAGAEQ